MTKNIMITFENVTKKLFLPMYNLHGKLANRAELVFKNNCI